MSRSSVKSLNHSFLSRLRVWRSRQADRAGFTLIEVMIAVTVTLLMMLGLAQMFKVLGDSMNKGRAGLELNNRLRGVLHRVRTDLDNVTAQARPPITVGSGQGYLKYYEGPASDYTLLDVNPALSRFGDVDDIFMATVKAKDTWFTGKVPRFIAERRVLDNSQPLADSDGNGVADELEDLVTIASQFAEVIIYAQPLVTSTGNPTRDPALLVTDPRLFEDTNPADGVPDGFRLHYRALLVRPDLNLDSGLLPFHTNGNVMVARSQVGPGGVAIPSPEGDMSRIFQYCDLSVRRVDHTGTSNVAANSLEDLANPANRFAHVVQPLPINPANSVVSMPVLALGPTIPSFQGVNPSLAGAGFLHPSFVLHGDRTGEDLLSADLLAFDIRAYDSSAPILQYNNEITLRPGDPGFETVGLPGLSTNPPQSSVAAYGEFVDLNWAGKLSFTWSSLNIQSRNLFVTELSGLNPSSNTLAVSDSLLRSGLSLPLNLSQGTFRIFQPSYDTFTDLYERDGILQAEWPARGMVSFSPSLWPAASAPVLYESWRATLDNGHPQIDAGTDGIDNNASVSPGIDDSSELETSPPFPVHLRGLQISIRLEDGSKKQFKQMSTVKEFVTN